MPESRPDDAIPAGMTTLRRWAARHGRTYDYVRQFWRRRDGFPAAVGKLQGRGRHGGGPGELLFDELALDEWLATQPDLRPPERFDPTALGVKPGDRITLGHFAKLIGKARATVTQHRDRSGFPQPGDDGTYRAAELFTYWNSRTGQRGRVSPNRF